MSNPSRTHSPSLLAVVLLLAAMPAGVVTAAEPPVNWDLTEIYPTDEAWKTALDELAGKRNTLDEFKGKLGSSAATLKAAMDRQFELQMQANRLGSYAGMRADEDLRESGPQGMRGALQIVLADLQGATAWVDPELLEIPADTIASFMKEEPGLAIYARYFERLEKRRPHVLDPEAERLMGMASRVQGEGITIGSLLRNAEMPWDTITLSDGTEIRIDTQGYSRIRGSTNREDRIAAWEAYHGQLQAFKGSLAATVLATIQEHALNADVRSYDSSLEASLAANEVDTAVYRMLISEINTGMGTLHRYLKLRGRILGIDDLRYHDIYPPLVDEVTTDYSWESSRELVGAGLTPLGKEYVDRFEKVLTSGWVDVYPRPGKRSGAYVNGGAYEVHPYMLLNHVDDYSSASTLAHEGGHLMHSIYSQATQPYPTSGYSIFVAEVASTVNEVLFFKHMVAETEDPKERLALLGNFLEGLRGTVFRQTMFAEFELAMHDMVERGEPLTGDGLNEMYAEMLRRYHGEADGVMTIDELYTAEWAFIPHFHYDFYVYQYATSYVAATALAEGIFENRPGARERYLEFLHGGSSKPAVELLKDAGVDMTEPEAIRAALRLMNEVMDQIDEILAARGS